MPPRLTSLADLIGQSPALTAVREKITRLVERQSETRRLPPILLLGETGTGKGLLARAIHKAGPRADGPFVDVNCAAIPETLLEAELFGFERGAFTDARHAKAGLFQTANRGTIFLDEVGLLPDGLQAKLLKVIEERAVRRLGSTRSEPVDVWIITATNEDLATATRQRRFREDLYHRLAVLTLWLPPLRERGEDILLLAEHFLAQACRDYDLEPKTFSPEARDALLRFSWPGNIRELANVIERVALLSETPLVTPEKLGLPASAQRESRRTIREEKAVSLEEVVGGVERDHLLEVLRQTDWNISRAATQLGISRNTLRYRIEKYGLRPGTPPPARPREADRPSTAVTASASPAPAWTPVPAVAGVRWERRRLTLLRSTLVPSATEALHDTSRALEDLVEKVRAFGGRVEELSPTGIVAAFGIDPVGDAPRRAAHAAMAIQKARERARRDDKEPLAAKIGVHAGQFLVGQVTGAPQIDLDAKREAWSVLEELMAQAEPDTILISGAAAPFLERRFELQPVGGAGQGGGRAFRLVGRERTGLGLGRRMAQFVGRHHELELLRSRWAAALLGRGQVVGIVGEAGIGKSRLLFEFRQSLTGERVTYLEGRCHFYGSAIPYLPVIDIIRNNCGITEADTPEAIAEKVRLSLLAVEMEPDEWGPYFLHLLGVKEGTDRLAVMSPEAIKAQTLETLRQMSLKGSRHRPIIFAVEDLHWTDKTSEDCFSWLVESLPGVPILFILTYRPGYRPPWIDKSYASQMALPPLPLQESLSVVHSILQTDSVPDPLTQLILTKAEGNPFFLEELARAVGEQGELRPNVAVPNTIEEVLLDRIDRLQEEPKRLLQTASILGREVSFRLLEAIWDGPGALDPHLRELTRLEFLYEQTGSEEPVYVFKHALTQQVVYESLLAPRRQALHAAAGRGLETFYADRLEEVYDRLAHHYSRSDKAGKAVEYLTRFAEKAVRGHAHTEAVRALEEALTHVERLPVEERDRRRFDLILRLASSLVPLGRFPETLELLLRERDRLDLVQDASLIGRYYFLLAYAYSFLGDHERTAQSAQRAIEEARRGGDEATMGKAHCLLAMGAPLSAQSLQGIEHGREAAALLERTEERWWLGQAHWVMGLNHIQLGEFESALEALARAHAIGEAMADPRLQACVAWVRGVIHAAMGEWETGIEACQRGLERSPDPLNRAITLGWLGYAYLEMGDSGEAIPRLEEAIQQVGQFGFRQFQGWFMIFLAEARRLSHQIEGALDLARHGLDICREAKFLHGVGWAHRALGRIAQARGALSDAEEHLIQAHETFASIQSQYELGRTHLDLAAIARARRNQEAVTTHLREAHRLFTTLRVPRYVQRTAELAKEFGVSVTIISGRQSSPPR